MILFLDLETTGLDPSSDHILEIYARVWGDEPLDFHQVLELRPGMRQQANPYVQEMHEKNGLWRDAATSERTVEAAAIRFEYWLRELPRPIHLAGNSIHFDRAFLKQHMPYAERLLHYRMLDVTSIQLMAESLGLERPLRAAEIAHRAKEDVEDSIRQFEWYAERLRVVEPEVAT